MTPHSRLASILCPFRPLALGGGDYTFRGVHYVLTDRYGQGAVAYLASTIDAWLDRELPSADMIEDAFRTEVAPLTDIETARIFLIVFGVAICRYLTLPTGQIVTRPVLTPEDLFGHALAVTALPELGACTLAEYHHRFPGLHVTKAHLADAAWAARTGQYARCIEALRAAERSNQRSL